MDHQESKMNRSKGKNSDEDSQNATNRPSLSADTDEGNGMVPCPYCHKKFESLSMHQYTCQSKADDGEDLKNATKQDDEESKKDKSEDENTSEDSEKDTEGLSWSDDIIDNVIEIILKKLNAYWSLSWVREDTGSYFTGAQEIHNYDFDYLLCPTKVECIVEPCSSHPCYCRVFIMNKHILPPELQEILGPNDEVTPSKFKEIVFKMFDTILKGNPQLKRKQNKSKSPAYTVTHCPDVGKSIDIDLVPCLLVQKPPEFYMKWKTRKLTEEERMGCPIYVVPKITDADDGVQELWRISFSTFERKIIRDKCDKFEKMMIQVIKHMFQFVRKDIDCKFNSYHITTSCLHFFEKTPAMSEYEYPGGLSEYQFLSLDSMICALQSRDIRHFFIPDVDLLQDVDDEFCQRFIQKLKDYKEYMNAKIQGKIPQVHIHTFI